MPGVVTMDDGAPNGTRTDHDRDALPNGVNGTAGSESATGKGKAAEAPDAVKHANIMNGGEVGGSDAERQRQAGESAQKSVESSSRMNDLPEEIAHITQGFVPLSLLLTRLAQSTHNSLQDKISELAKMPLPSTATVNGNSNLSSTASDDASNENLRKKGDLLNFIQDQHGRWVQALVITEWSRKSEMVSKLIDLKFHIDQQRILYDHTLDDLANVKRDLSFARMPSPDLKTALQILSTGSAPWMPDLQYIDPPALTPSEQLKWINELNTLLSLRLNLNDYDKLPKPFRNYTISSGRVTFKVQGEYEVDLTIADEDPEKQFWFIDFRFGFSPAASFVPDSLRGYLEACVNEALEKDGLTRCYNLLHEFVLTSKINELKRQAIQLSRSSWTGTLQVEPLNRALAIHYWTTRTPPTGPKSWVLVAIDSCREKDAPADAASKSRLVAKWYRNNKEVKDVEIPLNVETLSAESLLRAVVGRHIEHTLTSIQDKLLAASRFKNREAGLVLHIDNNDPAASSLTTQMAYSDKVSLLVEPTTGLFAIKPHSKSTVQFEHQLNNGKDPAEDGVTCLENIRCGIIEDTISRQATVMGWLARKSPLNSEEIRSVTKLRDWTRTIWLQRDGWTSSWYIAVFLSLGGDEWWLVEAHRDDATGTAAATGQRDGANRALNFHTRLPLNKGQPDLSDMFWNNLTLFASGMIVQSADLRELHRLRIKSRPSESASWSIPQQIKIPAIEIGLSALFPTMVYTGGDGSTRRKLRSKKDEDTSNLEPVSGPVASLALSKKQPWAKNVVTIKFKGVQFVSTPLESRDASAPNRQLVCTSEAMVKVLNPSQFAALKGSLDPNLSFNPQTGEFFIRLHHSVGEAAIPSLKSRLRAVDRFVNFLEALDKAKGLIFRERVTLREVVFSYGEGEPEALNDTADEAPKRWRVTLDLSQDDVDVRLEMGSPHSRIVDMLKRLVNQDGGIGALLTWLPTSLPAMSTIEQIEKDWVALQEQRKGTLDFTMKTMDWAGMRYCLPDANGSGERHLALALNIKTRRGECWWHIWRSDRQDGEPDDEFDEVLRPIWNRKGDMWQGLATGAAGKPKEGVVNMLRAVDSAVRAVALGETPPMGRAAAPLKGQSQTRAQAQGGGKAAPSQVVVLD